MTRIHRLLAFLLSLCASLQAKDLRILEITSDSLKMPATVEFLAEKTSIAPLKVETTGSKSFDWVDVPDEAKAARVKIGELATDVFDLTATGTTLVVLGQPALIADPTGAPKAVLGSSVKTDRALAPVGNTGWIYFGAVKPGGSSADLATRPWHTLYLVKPTKKPLNADSADTFAAVKTLATNSKLRVDFPLILRNVTGTGTEFKIDRSEKGATIRAGQYVLVKSLKDPDSEKGSVYAEVEVISP